LLQRPFTDIEVYKEYLCDIGKTPYVSDYNETILIETLATTIQSPIILFIDAFELMSYQQIQLTLKLANLPMILVVCAIRSTEAEKLFNDTRLNIKNRVYFTCNPLTTDEISEYVSFILDYMCETSHTKLFPKKIFPDLYRYTYGNWRRVNSFLHLLFKFIARQRAMEETIEQVSSIMLAKIALEQKIITIKSFKRKYFWDSLSFTFVLTEAFGGIISLGVFILLTFYFERLELNANSYLSSPLPTSIIKHIETPSSIEQIVANTNDNTQNIQPRQENSYETLLFLKIKSPIQSMHTKK